MLLHRPFISVGFSLLLLLSSASWCLGQTGDSSHNPVTFWFGLGLGPFAKSEESGGDEVAANINASIQWKMLVVSARTAAVADYYDGVVDYGILAGVGSSPGGPVHVSVALGVGAVADGFEGTKFTVPLEVQMFWRFAKFMGIGVYGFASVNDAESFGGATFALEFGKLR